MQLLLSPECKLPKGSHGVSDSLFKDSDWAQKGRGGEERKGKGRVGKKGEGRPLESV